MHTSSFKEERDTSAFSDDALALLQSLHSLLDSENDQTSSPSFSSSTVDHSILLDAVVRSSLLTPFVRSGCDTV